MPILNKNDRVSVALKCINKIAIITAFMMMPSSFSFAKPVTFEDVYTAPDNAELNLAYAQQEISNGNLLSASSALERLLLSQPNLDSARLLYAKVLFMLDDKKASTRELKILETRPLNTENLKMLNWLKQKITA